MKPLVIALYSPASQSGKSTVAEHLEKKHRFVRLKFAAILKSLTMHFLVSLGFTGPVLDRMIEGDLKDRTIPGLTFTPRDWQIMIGNGGRGLNENLWVDVVIREAAALIEAGHSVVIDDMRFENEMIRLATSTLPARFIRIVRSCRPSGGSSSEGLLEGMHFDAVLQNNGSISALHGGLDDCLAALRAA